MPVGDKGSNLGGGWKTDKNPTNPPVSAQFLPKLSAPSELGQETLSAGPRAGAVLAPAPPDARNKQCCVPVVCGSETMYKCILF